MTDLLKYIFYFPECINPIPLSVTRPLLATFTFAKKIIDEKILTAVINCFKRCYAAVFL
jgi:hypothetical protein